MTKITSFALGRKFKEVDGKVEKRDTRLPYVQDKAGDCYLCGKPVFVSLGQALKQVKGSGAYSHKICRKNK